MLVGEFIAEVLESEADELPRADWWKAKVLRETARKYRQRQDGTLVHITKPENIQEWAARLMQEVKGT